MKYGKPVHFKMSPISKRGLSVPWNFDPDDFSLYAAAIQSGKISWISNWEMWKPKGLPSNITYIPQCRTGNEADQIPNYLSGYQNDDQAQDFMGFNEPDIDSQANMSVDQAVELWRKHVLPTREHCGGVKFGSPAVSNGPNGISWLKEFFEKLGGTEKSGVDHVVIHYYSPNVEHFKQYVKEVYDAFKLPVWVTEFSCTNWNPAHPPSEEDVLAFMKEALRFLDEAPYVQRYAWFGAMKEVDEGVGKANGLQKDGGLSRTGELYTTL